ncbi:MAG: DinB family protein, partial [Candidatus Rokubacteria bacterium]|nr:DinB family protein [Candidatus Rokubacteria bacterium]
EWCAKEVLGHLIEAERRGFAGRIRQILAEADPPLATWDQEAVARARRDCEAPLADLLGEFTALRAASVELARGLGEADLGRSGRHPRVGDLGVGVLLNEWVYHDRDHLRQIHANVQAYVWANLGNAKGFYAPDGV